MQTLQEANVVRVEDILAQPEAMVRLPHYFNYL